MNTRFKRRSEGQSPPRAGQSPSNNVAPLKKGKQRQALIPPPDPKPDDELVERGRGQPPKLSLDDVVIEAVGAAKPVKRRDALASLGGMWATQDEVAGFFKVSTRTLQRFFERVPEAKVIYEDAKLSGNVSQRRRNLRMAEKSAAMCIFLSKNQLGMKDEVDSNVNLQGTILHRLMGELRDGQHGKVIEHDETESIVDAATS